MLSEYELGAYTWQDLYKPVSDTIKELVYSDLLKSIGTASP